MARIVICRWLPDLFYVAVAASACLRLPAPACHTRTYAVVPTHSHILDIIDKGGVERG